MPTSAVGGPRRRLRGDRPRGQRNPWPAGRRARRRIRRFQAVAPSTDTIRRSTMTLRPGTSAPWTRRDQTASPASFRSAALLERDGA